MTAARLARKAALLLLLVGPSAAAAPSPEAAPVAPEAPATPRSKATAAPAPGALGTLPADVGLPVGSKLPDLALQPLGAPATSLHGLLENGPVLLVFYRGGWCPYCNFQLHELATSGSEFQRRKITPVAISVDQPDPASQTQASWQIPFPVVSDPDLRLHEALKVVFQADAAEVKRLGGYGIDLEAASGRKHHRYAVPALFLVDTDSIVRWAHADTDYKIRPSLSQLLEGIDGALR